MKTEISKISFRIDKEDLSQNKYLFIDVIIIDLKRGIFCLEIKGYVNEEDINYINKIKSSLINRTKSILKQSWKEEIRNE